MTAERRELMRPTFATKFATWPAALDARRIESRDPPTPRKGRRRIKAQSIRSCDTPPPSPSDELLTSRESGCVVERTTITEDGRVDAVPLKDQTAAVNQKFYRAPRRADYVGLSNRPRDCGNRMRESRRRGLREMQRSAASEGWEGAVFCRTAHDSGGDAVTKRSYSTT